MQCAAAPSPFDEREAWGTIGHGAGTGTSATGRHPRNPNAPQVTAGQPNAQGDLDKAVIRRYIRRDLAKITYCYEKELLAKPSLEGTLMVHFFIDREGNVTSTTATGVDPAVATCVADVIKTIQFPKPPGGGGVQVNYPFNFRGTGAGQTTGGIASLLPPPPPSPGPPEQWTPLALASKAYDEAATADAGRDVGAKIMGALPEFERCLATTDTTGSIRVLLAHGSDGAVTTIRVGGLGDLTADRCIADAVRALKITVPAGTAELACDVVRGAAYPWRIATGGGYSVVGATKAGVVIDAVPVRSDQIVSAHVKSDRVALVIVEIDAPGSEIAGALTAAAAAPSTLVATEVSGASMFVGIGVTKPIDAVELYETEGTVRACYQGRDLTQTASTSDVDGLMSLIDAAHAACATKPCTLRVAVEGFKGVELETVAALARHQGIEVLGLASERACR